MLNYNIYKAINLKIKSNKFFVKKLTHLINFFTFYSLKLVLFILKTQRNATNFQLKESYNKPSVLFYYFFGKILK
jgi:hypothetical protein